MKTHTWCGWDVYCEQMQYISLTCFTRIKIKLYLLKEILLQVLQEKIISLSTMWGFANYDPDKVMKQTLTCDMFKMTCLIRYSTVSVYTHEMYPVSAIEVNHPLCPSWFVNNEIYFDVCHIKNDVPYPIISLQTRVLLSAFRRE